ncbi:ABC transporter permease [Phytoactinopolyspora halotolerans]|uniref:ABC transporter permease n=1 Tax=Phytoactinopolyspora halotolerans TaxID=1981512 RepID=A0A6L9S897_9ACTN|nr:ABC transporter permease [Phytoactinopolyspora halotolerans]NEE00921.1 ABC transporter permease [Phytoactinopolyspora halotolerans]
MVRLSWSGFRERWQLFVGAILSVAVGVALVQASLQIMAAAGDPPIPEGLDPLEEAQIRDNYDGAATLMGIAMVIAAFLAIFIVSSTFAFAVAQRRRDLALLRVLGARRRQLRRLLLCEGVLLGLCGAALGFPVGFAAVRIQRWLLTELEFLPDGFATPWAGWHTAVAAGTGLVVALLGVLAASRRAAKVRPLEALLDTGRAGRMMTLPRWIFGLLMLASSVGLFTAARSEGADTDVAVATSMGLAITGGLALSMLSPLVVPLAGRVLGLLGAVSAVGRLAEANLRDGVRRSAATAAPLIVLVALLLGLAGSLGSLAVAAGEEQQQMIDGDLIVESTGARTEKLASLDGVAVVSSQISVPMIVTITVDIGDPEELEEEVFSSGIVAVEPDAYRRTHRQEALAGSLDELSGSAIAVTTSPGYRVDLGTTVTARVLEQVSEREFSPTVVAVLPETLSGSDGILVPMDLFTPEERANWPAHAVVQLEPHADPDQVVEAIRSADLGVTRSVEEWASAQTAEQQDENVGVLVVLMGLSGLYAAMAVVNAVVISSAERKREFATARVTGLTRQQVVRSALIEAWAVTAIGVCLGGVIVAGTMTGIAGGIERTLGAAVVDVPWELAGAVAGGAFVVITVATWASVRAATRIAPIALVSARE